MLVERGQVLPVLGGVDPPRKKGDSIGQGPAVCFRTIAYSVKGSAMLRRGKAAREKNSGEARLRGALHDCRFLQTVVSPQAALLIAKSIHGGSVAIEVALGPLDRVNELDFGNPRGVDSPFSGNFCSSLIFIRFSSVMMIGLSRIGGMLREPGRLPLAHDLGGLVSPRRLKKLEFNFLHVL